MNNKDLSSLKKEDLISAYQKLQRKYNKVENQLKQALSENKQLSIFQDDPDRMTINNVIAIDKTVYSTDEKRQVLAWNEGCKMKDLKTVENHENYFILKNGKWYEIKTFVELVKSESFSDLNKIFKTILGGYYLCGCHSKTSLVRIFSFTPEKKIMIKKIIKILKKSEPDWWLHKEMETLLECKKYEEAIVLFIDEFLKFKYAEPLGNYNLYKVYVNHDLVEDTDLSKKVEAHTEK